MADPLPHFRLSAALLALTFDHFRQCGRNQRECQALWVSPWADPYTIREVIHPRHRAHRGGFELDSAWLNEFWSDLARTESGIRVQIHTHPGEAFHSSVDDEFPIIQSEGFLSLVIPNFAQGPVGFEKAYLARLQANGRFQEVDIQAHLEVIP